MDRQGVPIICKRPNIDIRPSQVSEETTTVKCEGCQCDLYIMRKNLGLGLIPLCVGCAAKQELKR